jgi:hypothetical protein
VLETISRTWSGYYPEVKKRAEQKDRKYKKGERNL